MKLSWNLFSSFVLGERKEEGGISKGKPIQEDGKRKRKASCLEKEQDKVVDIGLATNGKKRAVPSLDRGGEQHQNVDQSRKES